VRRFLYDTNVFVYALGGEHPMREPCRAILDRAQRGLLRGEAAVDLVQELAHQRFRQTGDRAGAARVARRVADACVLHALEEADLRHAMQLFEQGTGLQARDACFAAVALGRGIDAILSADGDFDEVRGLVRIDPADAEAVAGLGA